MEDRRQAQEENIMRKLLKSEVTSVVAIILAVVGFINWVTSPVTKLQTQLALLEQQVNKIENNHLVHIQESLDKNANEHRQIDEKLTRIITLMEK